MDVRALRNVQQQLRFSFFDVTIFRIASLRFSRFIHHSDFGIGMRPDFSYYLSTHKIV